MSYEVQGLSELALGALHCLYHLGNIRMEHVAQ